MKKLLQISALILFCVLIANFGYAQTTKSCVQSSKCFKFEYLGNVVNLNGTVTLSFKVTTDCNNALSNVAFQLPNGAVAINPKNSNSNFKYTLENTTNNPFYSVKFETLGEGTKNGQSDTFSYTITAVQFATFSTINVQAKAGGTIGLVTFDAKGCTPTPLTCPTPTATVAGPDTVCAFQDEPVTYTVNTTGTTDMVSFTWTVPADWEILEGQGTNTIQVQVGSESGAVTAIVTNSCGTKATDSQEVFADEECGSLNPLPVELTSFAGEATKSGVLLSWVTATEKNNEKFEVESSLNGTSFLKIGEVKGNGTTSEKHTYSFRDAKASNGTIYYRLKQLDIDGKSEYSKVISVKNELSVAKASLLVAPNPVTGGEFTISLEGAQGGTLQIADMNGRVVFNQEVAVGTRQLNLNAQNLNMSRGMYLINIRNNATSINTKLIVK